MKLGSKFVRILAVASSVMLLTAYVIYTQSNAKTLTKDAEGEFVFPSTKSVSKPIFSVRKAESVIAAYEVDVKPSQQSQSPLLLTHGYTGAMMGGSKSGTLRFDFPLEQRHAVVTEAKSTEIQPRLDERLDASPQSFLGAEVKATALDSQAIMTSTSQAILKSDLNPLIQPDAILMSGSKSLIIVADIRWWQNYWDKLREDLREMTKRMHDNHPSPSGPYSLPDPSGSR